MTHTQYLHPDLHTTEEKPEFNPTMAGGMLGDVRCIIEETNAVVVAHYLIDDNPSRFFPNLAVEQAVAHWTAKHPGRPLQVVPVKYRTVTDQVTENGRPTIREQQFLSQFMVIVLK